MIETVHNHLYNSKTSWNVKHVNKFDEGLWHESSYLDQISWHQYQLWHSNKFCLEGGFRINKTSTEDHLSCYQLPAQTSFSSDTDNLVLIGQMLTSKVKRLDSVGSGSKVILGAPRRCQVVVGAGILGDLCWHLKETKAQFLHIQRSNFKLWLRLCYEYRSET